MMERKTSPATSASEPHSESPSPELWRQVLRTCGSFNLRKATRVVTQLYDDILQPTGLRSTQVVLLVTLAAEGDMSLSRLARELVTSPSTLSRTLVPLARDGLIEHARRGKRGKVVRLTGQGEQALLAALPYWQQAQEKFIDLVGTAAWTDLNERLAKTVAAIRR